MCTEYIIEVVENGTVTKLVHVERNGSLSFVKATPSAYSYITKFKVKQRAEAVALKAVRPDMIVRVAPSFGGYVYGTKSTVPGLKVAPKGIRG